MSVGAVKLTIAVTGPNGGVQGLMTQFEGQASPSTTLPSSQVSPALIAPLPQFGLQTAGNATGEVATGSTVGGEVPDLESDCGSTGGTGVVFQFTAPSTGTFVFDTFGSDFDTVLAAFDACDERSCNDDSNLEGNAFQSMVSLNLDEGEIVWLSLFGFSEDDEGNYVLNVTLSG